MKIDSVSPDDKAVVKIDQNSIPEEIPVLPLKNQVAFPTLNMSLASPAHASRLIEAAMKGTRLIGIVGAQSQADEVPLPGEVYETGTVVQLLYVTRAPDNTVLLIVHGLKRFRIREWIPGGDYLRAKIKLIPETTENDIETVALHRSLLDLSQEIFSLSLKVPNEAIDELKRIR